MFELIRLEMKRLKWKAMFRTVLIMNAIILGLALLMQSDPGEFTSYMEVFYVIEILIGMVFIIYTSVLLSRVFVQGFRDQTISILFTYPINRKKLLMAKLILVSAFTFCLIFLSHVTLSACFYFLSKVFSFSISFDPLTGKMIVSRFLHLFIFSITCTGLSLISLFFGMLRKSVPTTIVSSVLTILLLNTDADGDFSLGLAFLALIGLLGFFFAYITIRRAVKMDL